MKKLSLFCFLLSLFFVACQKKSLEQLNISFDIPTPCLLQTIDPSLRSYPCDSLIDNNFTGNHCGFVPLSLKNYWVYEDSFFNNGVFLKVQSDTLRFNKNFQTTTDKLIWWAGNIDIGLPSVLYSNEAGIYLLEKRLFTSCTWEANKEYLTPQGDSARYLTRFEDIAAMGRSVKLTETITTPAGEFSDCIFFEKFSRNYRKDQLIIKPGIGVVKYTRELAPMGQPHLKLQQVATLKEFYLD